MIRKFVTIASMIKPTMVVLISIMNTVIRINYFTEFSIILSDIFGKLQNPCLSARWKCHIKIGTISNILALILVGTILSNWKAAGCNIWSRRSNFSVIAIQT